MITEEDKKRIVARAFYNDNEDQYEDFREALTEFMNGQNTSQKFIDFAVEPFIKPIEGHIRLVNDEGHVIAFREKDGYMDPNHSNIENEAEWVEYQKQMMTAIQSAPIAIQSTSQVLDLLTGLKWRVISDMKQVGN